MASSVAYGIFGADNIAVISPSGGVREKLLDDRHLSKSALRAFELLEFIAVRAGPVRATEVAQALELSPSSADQLLKSLASRAYLIFDSEDKLYRPSPRLLSFSAFLGQSYFGGRNLHAMMEYLVEKTDCMVTINSPFGRVMQMLDYKAPPGNAFVRRYGELFHMFNSAAGAAMLATWPIATVRTLIEQSRDLLGALADQPNVILAHLDEVRANGHAFGGLSALPEQCGLAVSLPKTEQGVELVLALRGSIDNLAANRWRFAALTQEAVATMLNKV